jgi:cystathionine gamma-synthase
MRSADVDALAPAARAHDTPLIVDDTVATTINIDAFQVADLVTTSLTKFFSGTGDVMGGSIILRTNSPFHDRFAAFLQHETPNALWYQDAQTLEVNSRDFPGRIHAINRAGEAVYDFLASHPAVDQVYYPKGTTPTEYRQLLRPGGGFGGLLSIILKDAEHTAPAFYDRLRISKGPSLGTNYSLACPFTLLAHYHELPWAAACGVSPHLVRLSVGMEDPEDLIARLEQAMPKAPQR